MPDQSPFQESQKLVRCQVLNRYHETSTRFVEIGAFRLWEYLMTNKHGLRITDPSLCLWIDDTEYQRSANLFDRAGDVEQVNRIVLDLFDSEYGFSQTVTRYARAAESDQVMQILRSHVAPELSGAETCHIEVVSGRVVRQRHPGASREMLLGLEG